MATHSKLKPGRPPAAQARYRHTASLLRAKLEQGVWPPLAVLPSLAQFARMFGVGRETARAAVGQLRAEGWIVPNARGRLVRAQDPRFARRDKGWVLVVYGYPMSDLLKNADSEALFLGLVEGLGLAERHFVVAHDFYLREALPERHLGLPLAGVLVASIGTRPVFERWARLPIPVVQVDLPPFAQGPPAVAVDNERAAREACERLVALGHRRIGFVQMLSATLGEPDPDSRERLAGFRAALRAHRLGSRTCPVISTISRDTASHGGLRRILTGPQRITAALCVDGGRARLVSRCAQALGLAVPRDLSIVAFSGVGARTAAYSGPRIDFKALGRTAVEVLLAPKPATTRFPAVWHEGTTLAPPL
ncbi:MAG: substrate-binding domain-containing protein [Planctomycetes bacterium]|nr:substrate-binding domain-containing protein [Planctomycetota bacterium]